MLRPALLFGRVPLFYFLLHLPLIHLLAVGVCFMRYGTAHWMFDRGLISLSDDLQILISRQANDQDAVRAFIHQSGRAFAPSRVSESPHPHFLQWHRENCFKQ